MYAPSSGRKRMAKTTSFGGESEKLAATGAEGDALYMVWYSKGMHSSLWRSQSLGKRVRSRPRIMSGHAPGANARDCSTRPHGTSRTTSKWAAYRRDTTGEQKA